MSAVPPPIKVACLGGAKRLIGSVALILAATLARPALADCDVHAGDDILAWVNGSVAALSRQLAQADYTAREQGMFMSTLDEHNRVLSSARERMGLVSKRMESFEAGAAALKATDAAILRERDAQDLLNELLDIKMFLLDLQARQSSLNVAPTLEWMKEHDLQHVGRATLLASFAKLGDDSKGSLHERYNVHFQVGFDENGHATGGSGNANMSTGWDDVIAVNVGYYLFPWGTVAAVVYEGIKFGISYFKCQGKIDDQIDKAHQAFDLLPGKLIQQDEQFALMVAAYQDASRSFHPVLAAAIAARQGLEDQWKDVFAFNISRLQAAHAELTGDKVRELQRQFGSGSLLDSGTMIKLADDLGKLNADLARRQALVVRSCGDVAGAEDVEDQLDGLRVARSIYYALGTRTVLAPLAPLLDSSRTVADARSAEALATRSQLSTRRCAPSPGEPIGTMPVLPADGPNAILGRALLDAAAISRDAPSGWPYLRPLPDGNMAALVASGPPRKPRETCSAGCRATALAAGRATVAGVPTTIRSTVARAPWEEPTTVAMPRTTVVSRRRSAPRPRTWRSALTTSGPSRRSFCRRFPSGSTRTGRP